MVSVVSSALVCVVRVAKKATNVKKGIRMLIALDFNLIRRNSV